MFKLKSKSFLQNEKDYSYSTKKEVTFMDKPFEPKEEVRISAVKRFAVYEDQV